MNKLTNSILKEINQLYDQASELAVKAIENEARSILKKHSNLNEFFMANGTHFFTDSNNEVIDNWKFKYLNSFNEMLNELDDKFHITGYPMRFTVNGEVINDWGKE